MSLSEETLRRYLNEELPDDEAAAVERTVRANPALQAALAQMATEDVSHERTLAAIWRHRRVTCPSRSELGDHVLGTCSAERADYIRFHLEELRCQYCQASYDDLAEDMKQAGSAREGTLRRRIFESSAGYFGRK